MTTPPALEQIARDKKLWRYRKHTHDAKRFVLLSPNDKNDSGCGSVYGESMAAHIVAALNAALQTAAKQPEGADWAEAAAEEIIPFVYGACATLDKESRVQAVVALIRRHAPRSDEQRIAEVLKSNLAAYDRLTEKQAVALTGIIMSALRPLLAGQVAGGVEPKRRRIAEMAYDGYAVYKNLTEDQRRKTSIENVSDVLDALVRAAMRPEQPEGAKRPADRPQDAQ